MSDGKKYIKQAIIAQLCAHPDAEKYRLRAFSAENINNTIDKKGDASLDISITLADLLTPDDEGKYIIDTPGFWKNFKRIAQMVREGGDSFSFDVLTAPRFNGGRSLLDNAVAHGGLPAIFTFDNWVGNYEEMEMLWYKVPVPSRKNIFPNEDGLSSVKLKRQLFVHEGKEMPEDRLLRAGLSPEDVRKALSAKGDLDGMLKKLDAAGDWLRKEYVLMADAAGDTCFDNETAWRRYTAVVKEMAAHGERFDTEDFLKKVSHRKNMLARAAEFNALPVVFTPEHWAGRLTEMVTLWSTYVLPAWKGAMTAKDFDDAYVQAESLTWASAFSARPFTGKQDLLAPLNANTAGEEPVLPLGLKALWDAFPKVSQALDEVGQKLTLADLRRKSGGMGNTCLMVAAKAGRFAEVQSILRKSGEKLSLVDYLTTDAQGQTLITALAEKNQLSMVFAPEQWVGRVADMKALWAHISTAHRIQVDFEQAEVAARQLTLKKKKPDVKINKPKKPGK